MTTIQEQDTKLVEGGASRQEERSRYGLARAPLRETPEISTNRKVTTRTYVAFTQRVGNMSCGASRQGLKGQMKSTSLARLEVVRSNVIMPKPNGCYNLCMCHCQI